jgi:hypothetical protein
MHTHEGKIVMIDQLSFAYASPNASVGRSILMIENSQLATENVGVRMYSSLMGIFDFMALIHHVYTMSSRPILTGRSIPFHTSYLVIHGPYLPQLHLVKVNRMLEWPCSYRQWRLCIKLFLTLPSIPILLPHDERGGSRS